ncbi:MAG: glycosyltransferase [Gemmatimonadetes bacterium]|jgi:glycosyltransferase involved in cell wall biosynthesis|nr:glycosyltransferase [Gemmatimonadota bacterium]
MKVCFITAQYPPLSRTYRRYQFARLLAAGGCDLEVVTHGNISKALGTFVDDPAMAVESAWPVHRPTAPPWYLTGEVLFRAGVVACPYVNWVAAATRVASGIVGPQDVVCSVYPPLANHMAAYRTAERTGARLVLDFRDEYLGLSRGVRRWQSARWQGRLLQRADLVSVATSTVADGLVGQGLPAARIHLSQNGYWEKPAALAPYPDDEPVRVVYIGALSAAQSPEILCDAVARLRRDAPQRARRIEVEIFGPDNPFCRRVLLPRLGPGITYGGYLAADRVTEVLGTAHVGFLSLSSADYAYAVPGKLYDYIAHARPVLASLPTGSASRLIEADGLGLVAPCGDVAKLAACLGELADTARCRRLHEQVVTAAPRHAAEPHFLSLASRIQAL